MKNQVKEFEEDIKIRIHENKTNKKFHDISNKWLEESMLNKYVYNFNWMGRPIIQQPTDILALQEIIWKVKPDLIIETGIAHGGSLIFSASMLSLLELSGQIQNPKVLGIDIDIRKHNKELIETHPMSSKITMIEGSSIDENIIQQVYEFAKDAKRILICLDSNHTHEHVIAELNAYSNLVSVGSYCIVFDTLIENMPAKFSEDRPWGKGNSPQTALDLFLKENSNFISDKNIDNKIMITASSNGFLQRLA